MYNVQELIFISCYVKDYFCAKCENIFYTGTIHIIESAMYIVCWIYLLYSWRLYQKIMVNFLYSMHFTVWSRRFGIFLCWCGQLCYFTATAGRLTWIFGIFLPCWGLKIEWLTVLNNTNIRDIPRWKQWTLHVSCKRKQIKANEFCKYSGFSTRQFTWIYIYIYEYYEYMESSQRYGWNIIYTHVRNEVYCQILTEYGSE